MSHLKVKRLASNVLLGPSKDGREWFAGIQLRLTFQQIRTLTYLFLLLTIRQKRWNKTLIVSSVLVISLKTTTEKSGHDVRNVSDEHKNFVSQCFTVHFSIQ